MAGIRDLDVASTRDAPRHLLEILLGEETARAADHIIVGCTWVGGRSDGQVLE